MAVAEFSLATLGFAESEEQTLQALLTLSERALSAAWRYVRDFKQADVVLVSLNRAEGEAFWQSQPHNYPAVCFVACSTHAAPDAAWRLSLSPGLLPSRKELIELLNTLSRHIAEKPPAAIPVLPEPVANGPAAAPAGPSADSPVEPAGEALDDSRAEALQPDLNLPLIGAAHAEPARTPPKPAANQPVFDPSRHFLGLLQTAMAAAEDSIFVLPGQVWLVAAPQTQRYYSTLPIDKLQPLLLAAPGDVQLRHLQIEKVLESAWARDMSAHPLAELLWHAALASSGGRLLAGCRPEDVVRLKQWPQVAHLPGYRKFLRVAAFMVHNAASLHSVAEHTGTPLEAVFDFHNACVAMGLVERLGQAELAAQPSSSPARELFRRISARLARPGQEGNGP
jgi:hypothetical protein